MNYELPSFELRVIEENNYLKFGEYLNDMPCGNTINKLSLDDLEYVKKLQQENEQLKTNWNKLKEYLNYQSERAVGEDEYVYDEIYNEMKELEQGSDSNE